MSENLDKAVAKHVCVCRLHGAEEHAGKERVKDALMLLELLKRIKVGQV